MERPTLSIWMTADMAKIDRETIRRILYKDLQMIKCIDRKGDQKLMRTLSFLTRKLHIKTDSSIRIYM